MAGQMARTLCRKLDWNVPRLDEPSFLNIDTLTTPLLPDRAKVFETFLAAEEADLARRMPRRR
jgi:hypothetical protein